MKTRQIINEMVDKKLHNMKKAMGGDGDNKLGYVNINKNSTILGSQLANARCVQFDSVISEHEKVDRYNTREYIRDDISDEANKFINGKLDSLIKSGKSDEEALKVVKTDSNLDFFISYDKSNGQFVRSIRTKDETKESKGAVHTDSIVEGATQSWNVGILNRIIRQPVAETKLDMLWSIEGFSNPFCEKVAIPLESFEGFATTTKANIKTNSSNPITANMSEIDADVFDVSVDFHSDFWDDVYGKYNPYHARVKADSIAYSKYVRDFATTAVRAFGDEECGLSGFMQSSGKTLYGGTPLRNIADDTSITTKGAMIVDAMKKIIFDFLEDNKYTSRVVNIACSYDVYYALTKPVYSDQFNSKSPIEVLKLAFVGQEVSNGTKISDLKILPDRLCDPSKPGKENPFNPTSEDLMFISSPIIEDGMGSQKSLVLAGEPLKDFITPAVWDRTGVLYTRHKRITDLIIPLQGIAKTIVGVGYQG